MIVAVWRYFGAHTGAMVSGQIAPELHRRRSNSLDVSPTVMPIVGLLSYPVIYARRVLADSERLTTSHGVI